MKGKVGCLYRVTHGQLLGVGFCYSNGEIGEKETLMIGVSWSDGGVSNIVFDTSMYEIWLIERIQYTN